MTYLDDFFSKKETRKDPDSRYALKSDKWDRRKAKEIDAELKEYQLASGELYKHAPTGHEAMRDTLMALFKVQPELRDPKEIRPSFLINHRVEEELFNLKEYERLHGSTRGDAIAAGLAAVDLEPDLEIIFDKLQSQQKQANQMEQMLQDAEGAADDLEDALAAAAEAASSGQDEEAKDYQEQAAKIQEQLDALKEALEQQSNDLQQSLDDVGPAISQGLKDAVASAQDNADALAGFDSWSMNPGSLKRLDPKARIELSKRLQSEKFKKMAQVIGRMQSMAMSAQVTKTDHAQEEIFDVTMGNHLARMLPHEVLYMSDPTLKWDWMRRFVEGNLLQYDLRGQETTERGGIIIMEDGSGSMQGEREIWSKATSLALLKIASFQKRSFTCIHFGGTNQYVLFEFDTSGPELQMKMTYDTSVKHYSGAEAVIEFADKGLNSGTDFMTPMKVALEILDKEYEEKRLTESDVVFLTDGQCAVHPDFLELFKKRQQELEFHMYGVAICTNPKSEPLQTICDGRVTQISELMDLDNMKPIFGDI